MTKKLPPTPEEYFEKHPKKDMFDYMSKHMDGWNMYVGPRMTDRLRKENFSKGAPMIYMKRGDSQVTFEYRDHRFETGFANEIFLVGSYGIGDYLITDTMKLIFTIGDRVYIDGQYGILEEILDWDGAKHTETEIGSWYYIKVPGIKWFNNKAV